MEPGQTVAHCEIVKRLGQGGMGVVYQARDTKLDRTVALKFLPPQLAVDPESNARFMREAKAASALDHANICTIYEIGETPEGALYIAMAFYEGHPLDALVKRGSLPVERVVDIATQLASALERAHDAGIVHRDLKPANVMVTGRGEVKLLDFGIAKLSTATGLTDTGTTPGTASYMSPEQVNAQPLDHRTDLWSFGVVLYEMLAGRTPFEGETAPAVMYSILDKDPAPLLAFRPDTPESLARVVDACLRKNPDERPRDARAVREALGDAGRVAATAAGGGELARARSAAGPKTSASRRLAALPQFTAWESLRDDAAGGLAGELYYLAGDHRQALDALRALRFQVPQTANSLAITAGSYARYRRAELELELGHAEVARQYYEGLVASFTPSDKFFLANAYERLGRIHEAAGRVDEAIYWYDRFVRSWADADAPLVATRRAVATRLEALRARADR
jgi:tRNA A-37 threonylcarbamoyl transferase component Bud32